MSLRIINGTSLLLVRPLLSEPFFISSPIATITRRHESSYRRTKKRLVVKPEPSFLSSTNSPQQDHIVFNPPSSAPSIYHTPIKFLPKDDRRRELFSALQEQSSEDSTPSRLPRPVRKPYEKTYHLTQEDMAEIRRLRTKDPDKWTRTKLAAKFKCSPFFVGIVCQASKERLGQQAEALEVIKARWGRKRQMAREDRAKRRELWGRDEFPSL